MGKRGSRKGKESIETRDIFQHRVRGDEKVKLHLVLAGGEVSESVQLSLVPWVA